MRRRAARYTASLDAPAAVARIMNGHATSFFLVFDTRVRSRAEQVARALRAVGINALGALGVRAGERIKTQRFVTKLHLALAGARADRFATMIVVGGGTLTDAAGFAAATYMRGIDWLPVATTVMGMADAAIGGKTALDIADRKNLVGAFWQPIATVADVSAVETLAVVQRRT